MTTTRHLRIKITVADLDAAGWVTDRRLRGIRAQLDGIPANRCVELDTGPLRKPDQRLAELFATLPNPTRVIGDVDAALDGIANAIDGGTWWLP